MDLQPTHILNRAQLVYIYVIENVGGISYLSQPSQPLVV